jgi:hypothetical protein
LGINSYGIYMSRSKESTYSDGRRQVQVLHHDDSSWRRLRIFDSTWRDGEQAPGNAMGPEQRLDIAVAWESLGVVLCSALNELGLWVDEQVVDRVCTEQVANRTDGDFLDLTGLRELMLADHGAGVGGAA